MDRPGETSRDVAIVAPIFPYIIYSLQIRYGPGINFARTYSEITNNSPKKQILLIYVKIT